MAQTACSSSISERGRYILADGRLRPARLGGGVPRIEHIDSSGGFLYVVNGKGGKRRTAIVPRPVMEALEAHINGRSEGYIFEGRDQGHISTRQIQRLLDGAAEKAGLQETRPGGYDTVRGSRLTCSETALLGGLWTRESISRTSSTSSGTRR